MPSPHPATRTLLRHRARVEEILATFARFGLAHMTDVEVHERLGDFVRVGTHRPPESLSDGQRLREALSVLGPTFIKIGQVLSTRIDLVGPDVAEELKSLQTASPADSPDQVRETVEADLGRPIEEAFAGFSFEPLASASIAQAHEATLHDGTRVVVKVQHADIHAKVVADFEILEALFGVVEEHDETVALYRPRGVIRQLRRTVLAELDLGREASALRRAGENFSGEPDVVIPVPYLEVSGPRVLTMTKLQGLPLTSVAEMEGVDRKAFSLRAARVFLEMIFRDGFFHADPHPGNVLVERTAAGLRFGILDWGEVGSIDSALEGKLAEFVLAVAMGERSDVADSLLEIVTAPPHLDLDAFRLDVSDWLDTYGTGGVEGIDVAAAVSDLTRVVREHRLRMPPDVAMLGKTLIQLQGDLTAAGADLQIADAFDGYIAEILKTKFSPERLVRRARHTIHDWDRLAGQAPRDVAAILAGVRAGQLEVPLRLETLDRNINRLVYGILAAALFSGSSNLWARRTPPLTSKGVSIPGAAGTVVSAAFAIRLLRAVRRQGGAG